MSLVLEEMVKGVNGLGGYRMFLGQLLMNNPLFSMDQRVNGSLIQVVHGCLWLCMVQTDWLLSS